MSDTVIRVENLSKKYVLGHQKQEGYATLRDALSSTTKALFRPFQNRKSKIENLPEEFWALKDVNFEIKQGDRVGIIGRNGAGKSTLLKILSRITEPTTGRISINGRVASLLEVGTGFHPELTGRENIFLNGAILGMSKEEIKRKFDEVVAFAEVEKFLDTPVKRYSSGMYVRLAFSVAAHLEPEILIVDEVLAVGDVKFQSKCLGKMQAVAGEGRTIIFVSHNIGAVRALCSTGIYLENGKVRMVADTGIVIEEYYNCTTTSESLNHYLAPETKDSNPQILEIKLKDGYCGSQYKASDSITISVTYKSSNFQNLVVGLHIYNSEHTEVIHSSNEFKSSHISNTDIYETVVVRIPQNLLNIGRYRCKVLLAQRSIAIYDCIENLSFEVANPDFQVALTQAKDWKGIISPYAIEWL